MKTGELNIDVKFSSNNQQFDSQKIESAQMRHLNSDLQSLNRENVQKIHSNQNLNVPKVKKSIAERLEKDSMVNRKNPGISKNKGMNQNQVYPNTYKGKLIGNYKVLMSGNCVLPPRFIFALLTMTFQIGIPCFQILQNNTKFVINQKENGNDIEHKYFIIEIVLWVLTIISVYFLFRTSMTDPGIIPRTPDS